MNVPPNPYVGIVGWCHNCEQLQWGDDALWDEMWWSPGTWDWCCKDCAGEPWGLGVWARTAAGAVDRMSPLGQLVMAGVSVYDLEPDQLLQLSHTSD